MTGPFNPPLVRVQENLTPAQRTRAAALLVAQQARPMGTATEHLRLADYIVQGAVLPGLDRIAQAAFRDPTELFGSQQMDLDPAHPTPHLDRLMRNARLPNFGDLDDEAGLRGELTEDDGLG